MRPCRLQMMGKWVIQPFRAFLQVKIKCKLVMLLTILFLLDPLSVKATVSVSAEHAVLMDQTSGRVLYQKGADDPALIASITKVMTAIIAIEQGNLNDSVNISDHAIKAEGSSIYLEKKDKFTLEELLYGLMLRSGNDAAIAISEHIAGSEQGFTYLMNEKAAWLGMTNTHFDNPHGLDSDTHYSTAYDMALLMKYAVENETFQTISATSSYQPKARDYAWINKNKLLTKLYGQSTGGKTGYTKAAGRTLISTAEKENQTLIAVTLNAPNDWQDHMQLFEWGFDHYPLQLLQEKEEITLKQSDQLLSATITTSLYYPLTETEMDKISYKNLVSSSPQSFQRLGMRVFYLDQQAIASTAFYQKSEQEEPTFWQKMFGERHD